MSIDKESTIPLYIQIRENLRNSIVSGEISKGDRLPPVTALAEKKGVTVATVRRALKDLIEEELIHTHVGRGTFVGPNINNTTNKQFKNTSKLHFGSSEHAARKLAQNVRRSLNEMLVLAQKPSVISFTRGIGNLDNLEKGILTRMTKKALAKGEEGYWDYGDPAGLPSLRKCIANRYEQRGISVTPEQILITNGSQQATALIAQQVVENDSRVLCETPCYTGVTNAFNAFGAHVETVIRDENGPRPDRFQLQEDANTVLYLCPILHNPMGTDCSAQRRKIISTWATKNRALILSDEVFHDLHFEEDYKPVSFLSDPGTERVAVMGSLSKSFISGLRVGWIVSSPERIQMLTLTKKAMDLGCPPLIQGIAREFLENGYEAHYKHVGAVYRERRDVTLETLERTMPEGVVWTRPQGGFQLWITLPNFYSSVALFLRCVDNGVAFLPGPLQDSNNRFVSSFRLCYGSLSPEEIIVGIERLAKTIKQYLSQPPTETGLVGLGDF